MRLDISGVKVILEDATIVGGVDLSVPQGAFVGLVGPNGSGKSTLLKTIYRIVRPAAGQVLLDDEEVWSMSIRDSARRTAVLAQESHGDFDFTVYDIVSMGRTPHLGTFDRLTEQDRRLIDDALDRVDASRFANRAFSTLSGGEKQRVLLARALAQQPTFLVLDEPTNHLDPRHQFELLDLVKRLGVTTLAALHDLNIAAMYCDQLVVLNNGLVVETGSTGDVLRPDLLLKVFGVHCQVAKHPMMNCPQLSFAPSSVNGSEPVLDA